MDQHQSTEIVELSARWQKRFDFFAAHGPQNSTTEARAAFKGLSFGERFTIGSNLPAFLFAPFYFFVKGMWRKGLPLLAIVIIVGTVLTMLDVPDQLARATGLGMATIPMNIANYAYYLHVTTGSRSWNPFEGMGRR